MIVEVTSCQKYHRNENSKSYLLFFFLLLNTRPGYIKHIHNHLNGKFIGRVGISCLLQRKEEWVFKI